MAKYLLTTIESYPVVIKCEKVSDAQRFSKRNAVMMNESTWNKNKHQWCQDVPIDKRFLADLLNKHVGNHEAWIRKEDAEENEI